MSVNAYLARQAGIISREQALTAGLSRDAVDRRIATRRWRPVHPRVYLAAGRPLDDEARLRAAVLWAGPGAVLSGAAASWWHGMAESPPGTVVVIVGRRRQPRSRDGVLLRARDLAPHDVVDRAGLPVTAPALTVLDAAVELGPAGGAFLDRALHRLVPHGDVLAAYRRTADASGASAARSVLAAASDRAAAASREGLTRALRAERLGGWRRDVSVAGEAVDVGFPATRVAVLLDGWGWRLDPALVRRDDRRCDLLRALGWTVLRFGWPEVAGRPRDVVAEIVRALAAALR